MSIAIAAAIAAALPHALYTRYGSAVVLLQRFADPGAASEKAERLNKLRGTCAAIVRPPGAPAPTMAEFAAAGAERQAMAAKPAALLPAPRCHTAT